MKISKYIFSLLLFFTAVNVQAQNDNWHSILVGIDLSKIVVPFLDSTRYGWEISGNYEIIKDLFGSVEIGSQTTNLKLPEYNYSALGTYTRLGVDYNFMKHIDEESTDKLFIGIRYGFSAFSHEAKNIIIKDEIWGDFVNGTVDSKILGANWAEVTTGLRAHLFNNFYLGWSARFRVKLWFPNNSQMQPYHIPGYGRAWSNSTIGFNYSLFYKIPLLKKKTVEKEKKK